MERAEQITLETDYNWYIHHNVDEIKVIPWQNRNLREAIYYVDKLSFNVIENMVIDFKLIQHNDKNTFMYDGYFDFRHYHVNFPQRKTWKKGKSIDLKATDGNIARIEEPRIFPLTVLSLHYDVDKFEKFPINLNASIWNNFYVPLFMGCGIQMDKNGERFDVYTKYFSGKKVVLYGAGKYGTYCYEKLSKEAEIVAWIDRDFVYMPWICCKDISALDCIYGLEFDAVLIAIENSNIWLEVKDMLIAMGIPSKKIY